MFVSILLCESCFFLFKGKGDLIESCVFVCYMINSQEIGFWRALFSYMEWLKSLDSSGVSDIC